MNMKMKNALIQAALIAVPLIAAYPSMTLAADNKSQSSLLHEYSFKDLGVAGTLKLQGNQSVGYLGFGLRLDQVAESTSVRLNYIASPSLLENSSHLKIYLNDQLTKVIEFDKRNVGSQSSVDIELMNEFITDYNQLKFELVGFTEDQCQHPDRANIWLELAEQSSLIIETQRLELANNLSILPAPFFDPRDSTSLALPLVTSSSPSLGVIKQSGIVASYFGALADWRDTDFSLVEDQLPQSNAIVLLTNDQKPSFLADLTDVDGAYLEVIDHPTSQYHKLLLVMGRDEADLQNAVLGLISNQTALNGPISRVDYIEPPQPRLPYDAPKWLNTSAPVKFGELISESYQFEQQGNHGGAIGFDFTLPPDLFVWRSKGAELDVSYRYSPLKPDQISQLTVSLNGQFSGAFSLDEVSGAEESNSMSLPVIDGINAALSMAPMVSQGEQNKLGLKFQFANGNQGECSTERANAFFGSINPNSTIDFSGFPHYMEMPNLSSFANSAFPYTRLADLADTLVILPETPNQNDLQSYINFMAFTGSTSGFPGYYVSLAYGKTSASLTGKDIFAVNLPSEVLTELGQEQNRVILGNDGTVEFSSMVQQDKTSVDKLQNDVKLTQSGAMATVSSFESSATSERTVVALNMSSSNAMELLSPLFKGTVSGDVFYGGTAVINSQEIKSFEAKESYYIGSLPIMKFIWFHASQFSTALLAGLLVFIVFFSYLVWRALSNIAHDRKNGKPD
ncbi:cellulose biosynthesis cyclic di-GMP-binding regulatory protein BcsB [Vibrio sp. RC27]